MQQWIDRWNAFWFPEATTLSLSMCRILVVAAQLGLFFPSLAYQINLLEKEAGFTEPQLLIVAISALVPKELFFTPAVFIVLYWLTFGAGITSLIGLFTRTSAFIFALGNWIFVAHTYSYAEEHHSEAILCIFLMLLAFSPSGKRLSVDGFMRRPHRGTAKDRGNNERVVEKVETAVWPLKLVQVLLALVYFSTGFTKIFYGGLAWMNGHTLQQYMFDNAVVREMPMGIWLAQQHTLCVLLSIGTILFELFFFLTLFVPWTVPFFLIGGTLFHMGTYVTMAAPFFQHIFLYSVFIDFEQWKGRFHPLISRLALLRGSGKGLVRYKAGPVST